MKLQIESALLSDIKDFLEDVQANETYNPEYSDKLPTMLQHIEFITRSATQYKQSPTEFVPSFNIQNMEDVKTFETWCIQKLGYGYHPDNDFMDYIHIASEQGSEDEMSFSMDEADYLNECSEKAFEICEAAGADIYEIGLHIAHVHEYNSNPQIKQDLINGLTRQTDNMLTSQAKGITGYFSACALTDLEKDMQNANTVFEISVYYGELESEDYDIFSEPEIDKFTCKVFVESKHYSIVSGLLNNKDEVLKLELSYSETCYYFNTCTPEVLKTLHALDNIEGQYIAASLFPLY